MSGTTEQRAPSTTTNAEESSPVTTTEEKPVTTVTKRVSPLQARLDAVMARQDATDAKLAAIVGVLERLAAPVTPVTPVTPVAQEPVSAPSATTVETTTVTTTTTQNRNWKCTAYVGKLQDRLTPRGKQELVVWVKPANTWYYPAAYTTVRTALLAMSLQVGDEVSLDGFMSQNPGQAEPKLVIRTCKVVSRKADRTGGAPAADLNADRVLDLDEVASTAPASAGQQAVLAQVPAAPEMPADADTEVAPLPEAAPVLTAEQPF